jgi:tRNA threonylcarbamoyl adenosine modification protein (Sua5/YciO/YrdC/YwlC family)
MATEVLHVLDRGAQSDELARAGAILRGGGLVAFPTETVYGIAVSADHPASVDRLYEIKGRARTKPMTMMVADSGPVLSRCPDLPAKARSLMKRFWPGPLTLVLPNAEGQMTGFRLPAHPLARGLVREAGVPLYVPSANRSGLPPATTAEEVLRQFPKELDLVIDGGPADGGVASTVVQVVGEELTVLREGAIPEERLLDPERVTILFVCRGNTDRSPLAAAILRRRLARHLGLQEADLEQAGYRVLSAGTEAREGKSISLNARRVARSWPEGPLDVDDHAATKITTSLLESATRVFCMEREQREQILAFFPHRDREVLLVDPEGADIEDPHGRSLEEYQRLARRLDAAATLIVFGIIRARA